MSEQLKMSFYAYPSWLGDLPRITDALLSHIRTEAIHVDELQALTGYPVAAITCALVLLELDGRVFQETIFSYCEKNQ